MTRLTLPDGTGAKIVGNAREQAILFDRFDQGIESQPKGVSVPFDVYLPYTVRRQATIEALPENTTLVDVSTANTAYFVALLDWWSKGKTFMVVEHDLVCRPDIFTELDECPEPWCLFAYDDFCHPECAEAWRNLLGCTRFRRELIEAVPDAVSAIPADNWDWHNVCDGIGNNLRAAGYSHHWHTPPVAHRHPPIA